MTFDAGRWRSSKNSALMAFLTGHVEMTPDKREGRVCIVIEGRILPAGGFMARRTIRAEFAIVFIILFMTGVAIGGRAFEKAVEVALLTLHTGVRAFEFESRKIVIKIRRLPSIRGMAGRTIRAELSAVWIIFLVTIDTTLRREREIFEGVRRVMAFIAGNARMFSSQFKCKAAVIESFCKAVHSVMASETIACINE